jgi:sulfur transfer protein SufE
LPPLFVKLASNLVRQCKSQLWFKTVKSFGRDDLS